MRRWFWSLMFGRYPWSFFYIVEFESPSSRTSGYTLHGFEAYCTADQFQAIYLVVLQFLQTRYLDSMLINTIIMPGHAVLRAARNTSLCLAQILLLA